MSHSLGKTRGNATHTLTTDRLVLHPESYDGEVVRWQVSDRLTGEAVGTVSFFGREPTGDLFVGYEIANAWRGRGLATEALTAVLAHVTETGAAATVIAETEIDHVASRRVMEKAGMSIRDVDRARVRYARDCRAAVRSAP